MAGLSALRGGAGLLYVLSWAGQWSTRFNRDDMGALRIAGGQELTHFTLHPGEEVQIGRAHV